MEENVFSITADYDKIEMEIREMLVQVEDMKKKKIYLSMHQHQIWNGKDGGWYTYLEINHKRKQIKRNSREKIEDAIVDFYYKKECNPYIEDVFEEWIAEKMEYQEISKGSADRYQNDFKRFFSKCNLTNKRIGTIVEEDIEKFVKSAIVEHHLTRKAYSGMRLLILGIFKFAKKKKYTSLSISYIMNDLQISRKSFAPNPIDRKKEVFTEDEIIIVTDYCRQHPDIWNLAILLCFETGLRVGELSALKHSDISEHSIHVQRTEVKCKDEKGRWKLFVGEFPKTEAGNRHLIIPVQASDTIRQIEELNPAGNFLFEHDGKRIRGNTFNKRLSRICDAVNIPHRTMHKIRKTYGTTLLDSDTNESLVAEMMGHADISTTKQYYYYSNKNSAHKQQQIDNAISF